MLHAGVELRGPLVDPRNARYVAGHPAGWMPQPWAANDAREDDHARPKTPDNVPVNKQTDTNAVFLAFKKLIEW